MMRDKLQEALAFAVKKHAGQWRDDERDTNEADGLGLPYAFHPVEVTGFLRHVGGVRDIELLCAGLLHDTLEDTQTTRAEIESAFGARVLGLVLEVTRQEPDPSSLAGMSKAQIWELRSSIMLSEIAKMSPEAQTIKLADRLSNLREAHYTKSPAKLDRYLKQSKEILALIPPAVNPHLWDAVQAETTRQ